MIKKFKQFNESIETLTEYELKIKNMYFKLKRGIGDGILDLGKVGQVSNTVIYDIEKRYPGATVFKKDGRYLLSIKENPVTESRTGNKIIEIYEEIVNNVTITDELNIEDIDTVAKSVLSEIDYGFYEQNKEVIIDMLETDI
jgi:hypothetical protein